jgi:rubrerythrin
MAFILKNKNVKAVICKGCGKTYNKVYHDKCPYCQERQINPLG